MKENILKVIKFNGEEFKLVANYWDNDPCEKCCFADVCSPGFHEADEMLECDMPDETDCYFLPIDAIDE